MFVKIVRNRHETVHECDSYTKERNNGRVHLEIKTNGKIINEDVECIPDCKIFIMNDFGKTIDREMF